MHSPVRCHTMPAGVPLVEFMHLVFTRMAGETEGNRSAAIQTRVASRPSSRPVTASDSGLYCCIGLRISSADSLPCVLIRCHTVRCTLALRRRGGIGRGAEGGGAGGGGVGWGGVGVHTPSIAFRHLPPNSARFSYATEGALFISA